VTSNEDEIRSGAARDRQRVVATSIKMRSGQVLRKTGGGRSDFQ